MKKFTLVLIAGLLLNSTTSHTMDNQSSWWSWKIAVAATSALIGGTAYFLYRKINNYLQEPFVIPFTITPEQSKGLDFFKRVMQRAHEEDQVKQ